MLDKLFRSFYAQNFPNDMEQQIEYFSIFGGLGFPLDVDLDVETLIKTKILDNYDQLYAQVLLLTMGDSHYHKLLSKIAQGDRRVYSAFAKANINEKEGLEALDMFKNNNLLSFEYTQESQKRIKKGQMIKRSLARHRISDKVRFTTPFLRFWFYFVYPFEHDIKHRHYEKFFNRFRERHNSYSSLVYEELSNLLLQKVYPEKIIHSHSYWDSKVEIDILARTEDEKIIVGECKWTNHKVNKKELHKIEDKCALIDLRPNVIALFSKRGFSKELSSLQSKELLLFSAQDYCVLLNNTSAEDIIKGFSLP